MFTINEESNAQELVNIFSSQPDEIAKVYLTQLFQISIQKNYLTIFDQLFSDVRVDVAANNNTAIIMACRWNRLEIVEKLLSDARVDTSAQSDIAIKNAVDNNNEKIVNLLLKDSRVSANDLMYPVIQYDKVKIAKELLTRNIPQDEIHRALNYGSYYTSSTELVKLLIPHADPSKITNNKVLDIISKMNEENMTDEIFSKKLKEMMAKRNVKGVFIDDQDKIILIKDNAMVQVS